MNDLSLEVTEIRAAAYRQRAEATANLALRTSAGDVAASYQRLADCWGKLAATVERAESAEKRDAA